MDVNDNARWLIKRVALTLIASKLAPTVIGIIDSPYVSSCLYCKRPRRTQLRTD